MTKEEHREQVIQQIADVLRMSTFKVEYQVKEKPEGVKVIIEVSQEVMDEMTKRVTKKDKEVDSLKKDVQ